MRFIVLANSLVVTAIALSVVEREQNSTHHVEHVDSAPPKMGTSKIWVKYDGAQKNQSGAKSSANGHAKADAGAKKESGKEKGEQKEKAEEKGGDAKPAEGGAKPIAIFMLCGVVGGAIIFAMSQTQRPHVANNTILCMDNVILIFMAVLWFSAFSDVLEAVIPPEHHLVFTLAHVLGVLSLALFFAWRLRHGTAGLAAFCGAGAHFSGFMSAHFADVLQRHHFTPTPMICALGLLADIAIVGIFLLILNIVKRKVFGITPGVESEDESANRFLDRWDDVENDFSALGLATYWVIVVQFKIVNKYPDDADIDPGDPVAHSTFHRQMMLVYALCTLVVAMGANQVLGPKIDGMSYLPKRVVSIFVSFLTMSWVFAFSLWGKMHFYEDPRWSMEPMFSRITFAGLNTVLAIVCILLVTSGGRRGPRGGARGLLLVSAGLLCGFAWEESFDAALDGIFEGMDNAHWMKAFTTAFIVFIVAPIQLTYCAPLSLAAEDAEEKAGGGTADA